MSRFAQDILGLHQFFNITIIIITIIIIIIISLFTLKRVQIWSINFLVTQSKAIPPRYLFSIEEKGLGGENFYMWIWKEMSE